MEKLQVAVSSASCGEFDPRHISNIVVPSLATAETVRRVGVFRDHVAPFFGPENVSVSLHPGFTTDVPLAARLYADSGIAISSIDTPDIVPVREIAGNVLRDGWAGNIDLVRKHISWGLQNVQSEVGYDEKVGQSMEVLADNPAPHIVRANAKIFLESQAGEALRSRLRFCEGYVLAIEIDAEHQTPSEYINFLLMLDLSQKEHSAPIAADLDLGHLGRSRFIHRKGFEIPQPMAVLDATLRDTNFARMIALVSMNQYKEGEDRTHENFLDGSIDFAEVTRMLGRASRNNMLWYPPMVMAEFYPMEYGAMLSEAGAHVWRRMAQTYYNPDIL